MGLDEPRGSRLSLLPSWAVRIGAPVSGGARQIRVASTNPPIGLLGDSDPLPVARRALWQPEPAFSRDSSQRFCERTRHAGSQPRVLDHEVIRQVEDVVWR